MTDRTVLITIAGGSIRGFAVHTNMSMPGKTFSYLFICTTTLSNNSEKSMHYIWKILSHTLIYRFYTLLHAPKMNWNRDLKSPYVLTYKHVKEREIPVREAALESATIDGIPSNNYSEKPIKTKPKLWKKQSYPSPSSSFLFCRYVAQPIYKDQACTYQNYKSIESD